MPAPTANAPPRRRGGAGGDIAELSCEDGRIATQPGGPGCNAPAPGVIRRPPGLPRPLCALVRCDRRATPGRSHLRCAVATASVTSRSLAVSSRRSPDLHPAVDCAWQYVSDF